MPEFASVEDKKDKALKSMYSSTNSLVYYEPTASMPNSHDELSTEAK